ncbi:NAD-binding protein [Halobaculum sp. D14]|uniref:NAD-binding protein n=1 Tax=Halobaculum sp. D14 TaxID=3421642 RepID=UPI003EBEA315
MTEWRERLGGRAAVWLTSAVAVLSVVVGIAGIAGVNGPQATIPFASMLPEQASVVAGFTGAFTGFLLLVAAHGLRRGFRAAWLGSLLLLPLTGLQGVVQSTYLGVLLAVLSVASLLVLAANRGLFQRELDLTPTQWAAVAGLVGSLGYSTAGAYALNDQFTNLNTLTDAVYFSVVTASTVGYGDVTPTSMLAKWFAMSALVLNVAAFAVALGVLFTPAIEARLTTALGRMTDSNLDLLENHVLVLGHGELTEPLIEELAAAGVDFLIITPDETVARQLGEHDIDVFTANPSDEEPLRRAHIESARAVVAATNNDAEDALAILTARELNPDVPIVAASTDRENVDKLRRAGADTVISPASIGGHLLVESALQKSDSEAVAREILEETGETAPEPVPESASAEATRPAESTTESEPDSESESDEQSGDDAA